MRYPLGAVLGLSRMVPGLGSTNSLGEDPSNRLNPNPKNPSTENLNTPTQKPQALTEHWENLERTQRTRTLRNRLWNLNTTTGGEGPFLNPLGNFESKQDLQRSFRRRVFGVFSTFSRFGLWVKYSVLQLQTFMCCALWGCRIVSILD